MNMWVGTDGLQTALGAYTARLARKEGVEQEPDRTRSARFAVHKPPEVNVPVYVTCDPADVWACKFRLSAQGPAAAQDVDHDPDTDPGRLELEIMLPVDRYDVTADFDKDAPFAGGTGVVIAFPPEAPLCLPIARRT
jgi:hypothetical protein